MALTMGEFASKVASAAKKVDPEVERNLRALAQVGVGEVKTAIQDMHAVDTGTMLNSSTADRVGDNTYLVGPTVDYASYVALGTSRVAARPFHTVAAKKMAGQIKDFNLDLGV